VIQRAASVYRRLAAYLRPYWTWLVVGGVLAAVASAMNGLVAWLVKPVMDGIFVRQDTRLLLFVPPAVLAVYATKGVTQYFQAYLMAAVGERVVAALRRDLYRHLQGLPLAFFASTHSAELISRITNDVSRLQRLCSGVLVTSARDVATVIALGAVMFARDWRFTLLALLGLPLIAVVGRVIGRRLYRINRRAQQRVAEFAVLLQEAFSAAKIVKAFGREHHERERFDRLNGHLLGLSLRNARIDGISSPLAEVLGALGIVAALWYGGSRVTQGEITPGAFFSFAAAMLMLYAPVSRLPGILNAIQQALPSAERVFEVLDLPPAVADRPGAVVLDGFRDALRFEHVSFRYADAPELALDDISLAIGKGEVVALVGLSGAGKSTLMDLVPRFHDVTAGRLTIDGHDVRDVTQASLRAQIALVTQETLLFSESIAYNIGYGREDATPEEIVQAARSAYADEFIRSFGEGYQTAIGERGARLSGGQRQRLAIARAFLKNPPILILDEATSDLDAHSEAMVQQALADLMRGRTVLIIAHRLATVRAADRIVVVEGGRIVAVGRHDELLAQDTLYRRLHALQMLGAVG
jgi:ATP-binding cassette, subfamily B, bacterial MsbA